MDKAAKKILAFLKTIWYNKKEHYNTRRLRYEKSHGKTDFIWKNIAIYVI
jgi:hypothetical protein